MIETCIADWEVMLFAFITAGFLGGFFAALLIHFKGEQRDTCSCKTSQAVEQSKGGDLSRAKAR